MRALLLSEFNALYIFFKVIRAFTVQDQFIRESNARVDQNQSCYFPSCVANR